MSEPAPQLDPMQAAPPSQAEAAAANLVDVSQVDAADEPAPDAGPTADQRKMIITTVIAVACLFGGLYAVLMLLSFATTAVRNATGNDDVPAVPKRYSAPLPVQTGANGTQMLVGRVAEAMERCRATRGTAPGRCTAAVLAKLDPAMAPELELCGSRGGACVRPTANGYLVSARDDGVVDATYNEVHGAGGSVSRTCFVTSGTTANCRGGRWG